MKEIYKEGDEQCRYQSGIRQASMPKKSSLFLQMGSTLQKLPGDWAGGGRYPDEWVKSFFPANLPANILEIPIIGPNPAGLTTLTQFVNKAGTDVLAEYGFDSPKTISMRRAIERDQ